MFAALEEFIYSIVEDQRRGGSCNSLDVGSFSFGLGQNLEREVVEKADRLLYRRPQLSTGTSSQLRNGNKTKQGSEGPRLMIINAATGVFVLRSGSGVAGLQPLVGQTAR